MGEDAVEVMAACDIKRATTTGRGVSMDTVNLNLKSERAPSRRECSSAGSWKKVGSLEGIVAQELIQGAL